MGRSFLLFLLSLLFLDNISFAQANLVPNYSFETFSSCPSNINQLSRAVPWYDPTNSGSDYYHQCSSSSNVGVPYNASGFQNARTGLGYAGFYPYTPSIFTRSYLQIQLIDSLKPGVSYCTHFFVSLADTVNYAIDAIGAYFSSTPVTCGPPNCLMSFTPQVSNSNGIITDTMNWVEISGIFTAIGGEQYITIGNFKNDASTNSSIVNNTIYASSYYLIDDVSVVEITPANAGISGSICLGDSIQLGVASVQEVTYSWSPSTGLSDPSVSNPKASPQVTTTYTLTQTQCNLTSSSTVTITVNDCTAEELFIPTAFSPNGDNINDILHVRGPIKEMDFYVYDRWGEEVFHTTDPGIGWDGKYKGKMLDPAVFVFYLKATLKSGEIEERKGNINLIR